MLAKSIAAAEIMIHLVNHSAHGYSQPNRMGDGTKETVTLSDGTKVEIHGGDYDCSEAVRMCYAAVGVLPKSSYMWTGNEIELLTSHGFTCFDFTKSNLNVGDVLWNSGHTEIYVGNGKQAGFHIDEKGGVSGPTVGDQTGRESYIKDVASTWVKILRYKDSQNNVSISLSSNDLTGTSTNSLTVYDTSTAYALGVSGQILPAQSDMNPYAVIFDESTTLPKFSTISSAGVCAAFINMGEYYSKSHSVNSRFRSTKLNSQVKFCKDNFLPYGLMSTVRARTTREAYEELKEIRLTLLKYPPNLGFWAILDLKSSKSINDKILNIYKICLEDMGFKNQIGIYASKSQLDKISWDKHYNDWYLWAVDHVTSLNDIPSPVSPDFFMYKNVS